MAILVILKAALIVIGGWKVGSLLANWSNRRDSQWITLSEFDPTRYMSFTDPVHIRLPKGKLTQYLICKGQGNASFTHNAKKAALARVLGQPVFVFKFDRYNNFVQFKSCSASVPGRNYNFLTETFEGPVNEKDVYVQHIPT